MGEMGLMGIEIGKQVRLKCAQHLELKCVVSMAEQARTPSLMPSPWKKSGVCSLFETDLDVTIIFSRGCAGTGTIMTAHNSIFMGPIKVQSGINWL